MKRSLKSSASVLMAYAIICLVTSLALNMRAGPEMTAQLTREGGEIGPVTVEKAGEVYRVDMKQALAVANGWSFVDGEVLDSNREFLFGFGDEVWTETGYDDEGPWAENQEDFSHKITFPEAGTFYLSFKTEQGAPDWAGNLQVSVTRLYASSLLHFWLGLSSVVVSMGLWIWAQNMSTYRKAPETGARAGEGREGDDE